MFRRSLDRCFKENRATFFSGVDMYGYSQDGNPYNDFDYTGAVFRVEQSWSTNEPCNFGGANYGGRDQVHFDAKLDAARENYLTRIENPSDEAEMGYQQAVTNMSRKTA